MAHMVKLPDGTVKEEQRKNGNGTKFAWTVSATMLGVIASLGAALYNFQIQAVNAEVYNLKQADIRFAEDALSREKAISVLQECAENTKKELADIKTDIKRILYEVKK